MSSPGDRLVMLLAAVCCAIAGCRSTVDSVDIKDVYGPAGRHAKNALAEAQRAAEGGERAGAEELEAAHQLYKEEKYTEARKAYRKLVKKYSQKKTKNEAVEEEALFYQAESDFQLGHYPAAQDGYEELLKKFPSTGFVERATKRLYHIARFWLNSPKPPSEIELASFTDDDGEERLKELPEATIPWHFPLTPNLFDKSRPLFDTEGRALQALRSVYLHDPDSKLAAQAVMTQAVYHLRKKDYREADRDFNQIREQYHDKKYSEKNELVPAAYVLGAHSSLRSYQGSRYDGRQLEEARKLTQQAIRLNPDLPQRPKLEADLRRIEAEMAEREWTRVLFHRKRGEKDSEAVYCENIMNDYPDSPRAEEARERLLKLGPQHAAGILMTPLFVKQRPVANDDQPDETRDGLQDEPQEPGRLRASDAKDKPILETE
jgi:outer membrane protein assembly factor BamD (BamD/ComL family)